MSTIVRWMPINLVGILRGRQSLVNLIPYNPVAGLPFRTPRPQNVARFVEILEQGGLTVAIRHRKGARINAACGQLRREVAQVTIKIEGSAATWMVRPIARAMGRGFW